MLPIERKNTILSRLMAEGKVIVSDLALEFDVTEETIRRDLDKLEKEGLAKKTYGGAVKNENLNTELPLTSESRQMLRAKNILPRKSQNISATATIFFLTLQQLLFLPSRK